nr:glycoside hydrolase family 16 protein [Planctomycetota bacterium]
GRKNYFGYDYITARLNTSWKKNFTYGRMEARIKLPVGGQGIWPAFWMLGQNYEWVGWPMCGELDILEAINDLSLVYGTIHYGTAHHNGGAHYPGVNLSDDYHIYAVEWDTYEIRWYFDNVNYHTDWGTWWTPAADYPAPFNAPFFFILNLAIGGDWPGYPDGSTPFPQTMYIDYVRAYEWRQ